MRLFLLFVLSFVLAGCFSDYQKLEPNIFYKRDLVVEVDKQKYEGVFVLPHRKTYDFTFESTGEISYIIIRTCHREDVFQPERGSGLFGLGLFKKISDKKLQYTYYPMDIESREMCPLRVDSYDKKTEQHAWSFVDFRSPELQMSGAMVCNGKRESWLSVAVCQVRAGLVQEFHFDHPVRFAPQKPDICSVPVHQGNNVYEVKASPEECLYAFEDERKRRGRITVIGYSGLLVRGAL